MSTDDEWPDRPRDVSQQLHRAGLRVIARRTGGPVQLVLAPEVIVQIAEPLCDEQPIFPTDRYASTAALFASWERGEPISDTHDAEPAQQQEAADPDEDLPAQQPPADEAAPPTAPADSPAQLPAAPRRGDRARHALHAAHSAATRALRPLHRALRRATALKPMIATALAAARHTLATHTRRHHQ